ncbi:MAG: hypothetical protein L0099_06540 [Acidobacteria bacterium]|nr:hypothetical protein [Acidobacteriota bacterium]
MTYSITGTVVLQKSENSQCRCCDGPHIFSQYLELEPYESAFPAHVRRDVDQWLHTVLHFKNLEGKAIEITARVVV